MIVKAHPDLVDAVITKKGEPEILDLLPLMPTWLKNDIFAGAVFTLRPEEYSELPYELYDYLDVLHK